MYRVQMLWFVLFPLSGANNGRQGRSDRFGLVAEHIGYSALTVPLARQPRVGATGGLNDLCLGIETSSGR